MMRTIIFSLLTIFFSCLLLTSCATNGEEPELADDYANPVMSGPITTSSDYMYSPHAYQTSHVAK